MLLMCYQRGFVVALDDIELRYVQEAKPSHSYYCKLGR